MPTLEGTEPDMIDHLNPYLTSTLVADRLQAARDPRRSGLELAERVGLEQEVAHDHGQSAMGIGAES